MSTARDEELALLFREARTHNVWLDVPVEDALLERVYELAKMGPTGGNSHSLRAVFVKSQEAKARLLPAVAPMNVEKARTAPVTAILAYDPAYYERMPQLFPARAEMRDVLAAMPAAKRDDMGMLNATLAAGYFIIAARSVGLDVGPMGGFERSAVDAEFFTDSKWRSFLLVNLGHGDREKLFPRNPRLTFDEACRIA